MTSRMSRGPMPVPPVVIIRFSRSSSAMRMSSSRGRAPSSGMSAPSRVITLFGQYARISGRSRPRALPRSIYR